MLVAFLSVQMFVSFEKEYFLKLGHKRNKRTGIEDEEMEDERGVQVVTRLPGRLLGIEAILVAWPNYCSAESHDAHRL